MLGINKNKHLNNKMTNMNNTQKFLFIFSLVILLLSLMLLILC